MHLSTTMMKDGRNGMLNKPKSPCFIMQMQKLEKNLQLFITLQEQTSVTFLYTLKCFNEPDGLIYILDKLSGFSLGNLNEYTRTQPFKQKHIHAYAPAFFEQDIRNLAQVSDTMSFNSVNQWKRYTNICAKHCSLGLRLNPKLALKQPAYCDASAANSRFGVDYAKFLLMYERDDTLFKNLEGLHFHTFCHQNVLALETLLQHIQTTYAHILPKLKWLNLGGGLNFTCPTFSVSKFTTLMNTFQNGYPNLKLYFEPGSSVVVNTGYFLTTVLDVLEGNPAKVILDTSIECHTLDVAITKQTLNVNGASQSVTPFHYELTGMSCIAGDIFGSYYFDRPLHVGDNVIFEDMMGYTLVKQTEFNGIQKARFYISE